MSRYIGYYYEYDNDGNIIDDFKEWCDAESKEKANQYFLNNYRHNPNIKLNSIRKEK